MELEDRDGEISKETKDKENCILFALVGMSICIDLHFVRSSAKMEIHELVLKTNIIESYPWLPLI